MCPSPLRLLRKPSAAASTPPVGISSALIPGNCLEHYGFPAAGIRCPMADTLCVDKHQRCRMAGETAYSENSARFPGSCTFKTFPGSRVATPPDCSTCHWGSGPQPGQRPPSIGFLKCFQYRRAKRTRGFSHSFCAKSLQNHLFQYSPAREAHRNRDS